MYWLFIYASKYFLTDRHYETLDRIYWYPRKWQNLLNFLQDAYTADVTKILQILKIWITAFQLGLKDMNHNISA